MTEKKNRLLKFLVPVLLVIVGVVGFKALTSSKTPPRKQKPPVPVPLIRVLEIETGPQQIVIHAQGTVRPLREIQLVPQVSGRVVSISSSMVDGGEFEEGDILLSIDPEDYRLALALAESQVKNAESQLKLMEEEAAVAKEEWQEAYEDAANSSRQPPPLVAKEPQLKAARARLEADRANLKRTLLSLERTKLYAPFSGRVSNKRVDIGQHIAPGQALATLYSTEAAEIVLPMEDEDLYWFHVPGLTPGDAAGSQADVIADIAGRRLSRKGIVVRAEGKLDERTRMINVIVQVDEPYAKKPPLAVGLFVEARINGQTIPDGAVIPRSALHAEQIAWVLDGDRLRYRKVQVARYVNDQAVIMKGLVDGDRVIVTLLDTATDGMKVRIFEDSERMES